MNVEIGTEAAQFPEKGYINGMSVAVRQCLGSDHRVDRVLGFFSSCPNCDSPTPTPPGECVPPLVGGDTHLRERGGVANSDEGTDTVELWVFVCGPTCHLFTLHCIAGAGCGLAYPYDWRGFEGPKNKISVGLLSFNPLWANPTPQKPWI